MVPGGSRLAMGDERRANEPAQLGDAPVVSDIDFLAGSRHRLRILNLLRGPEAMSRRNVRASVDASRATVRRTLEGLLSRGWVESTEDGYRVTAAGELVATEFTRLSETLRLTEEFAPLLEHVPPSSFDIEPEWLAGAELTVSTAAEPYAPAQTQTETIRTADRFRGFLPAIELDGTELVHDRITSGEFTASIVLGPACADHIREEPFAELFREKLATGRFEAAIADGPLPFYLGLPDDERIEIGVADDEGIPRALVQSSNTAFREWGEATFERYERNAERLSEEDFDTESAD